MSKILLALLLKPFNARTSINPLVNPNFHFVIVVVVVVVDITCMECLFQYFFLVPLKYLKTYGNGLNLSITHSWLITHVFQVCLYMHILLPLKWLFAVYMHIYIVYLCGNSRDIRGLYSSNFSLEKYILVKM